VFRALFSKRFCIIYILSTPIVATHSNYYAV
jgi:hypothetical protein